MGETITRSVTQSGWQERFKPGIVYGETDDFSYNIVRDPVHIHQLNATILDQLGVDHRLLSVKFQGLDHRLTGVEEAKVIDDILA